MDFQELDTRIKELETKIKTHSDMIYNKLQKKNRPTGQYIDPNPELIEHIEKLEVLIEKNLEIGYDNIKTLMYSIFDDQGKKIEKIEADCADPCDLDAIVKDMIVRMEKLEQNFSMATLTTAEAIVIINKKLKTPGSITSIQDYDFSKLYKQVKWKKYTGKDPGSGDLIVLTKDNRIEKGVYWHPVDCIHKDSIWQKTDYYIHLEDLRGLPKDASW